MTPHSRRDSSRQRGGLDKPLNAPRRICEGYTTAVSTNYLFLMLVALFQDLGIALCCEPAITLAFHNAPTPFALSKSFSVFVRSP